MDENVIHNYLNNDLVTKRILKVRKIDKNSQIRFISDLLKK